MLLNVPQAPIRVSVPIVIIETGLKGKKNEKENTVKRFKRLLNWSISYLHLSWSIIKEFLNCNIILSR